MEAFDRLYYNCVEGMFNCIIKMNKVQSQLIVLLQGIERVYLYTVRTIFARIRDPLLLQMDKVQSKLMEDSQYHGRFHYSTFNLRR